jgi:Lipocalin-like domain
VERSLFPNWVGTDQQRSVELTGDRLILSGRPLLLAGIQQVPRLVWERVNPFPRVG